MEERENRRAEELVKTLHGVQGIAADSTGKLYVVSYPKMENGPLSGFTKKDLDRAIELKYLKKADSIKVGAEECHVYMITELTDSIQGIIKAAKDKRGKELSFEDVRKYFDPSIPPPNLSQQQIEELLETWLGPV